MADTVDSSTPFPAIARCIDLPVDSSSALLHYYTVTLKRHVGYKARRWVVERTHSWMNRFRGVLIRWDKKGENYLALLHLACAWITYRAAGLLE